MPVGSEELVDGRYRLEKLLSRTGNSEVYLAEDSLSQQPVVVKHLRSNLQFDQENLARFMRESEALRALDHPNIVKVLDVVVDEPDHFIVMEYIRGGDLKSRLQEETQIPVHEALEIALDLTDAVTRAHRLGIVHRDIKPSNILLEEGHSARLTDFGIAHFDNLDTLTHPDTIIGTPAYMSPEQVRSEKVDERVDVWGFGVVLFEMLTGRHPFAADNLAGVLSNIIHQPPSQLSSLRPDLPDALSTLLSRMLEKNADNRIQSIRAVGTELEKILKGLRIEHNLPPARVLDLSDGLAAFELAELRRVIGTEKQKRLINVITTDRFDAAAVLMEAARSQIGRFADGVFAIPHVTGEPLADLLQSLARTLGVTAQPDDLETAIKEHLSTRHVLLLILNLSADSEIPAYLTGIVEQVPSLVVAVVSSAPFGSPVERCFDLEYLEKRAAHEYLMTGLENYQRHGVVLPVHGWQLLKPLVDSGELEIPYQAEDLWQKSRMNAFQRRQIYRLLLVLLCSAPIVLISLPFAFLESTETHPLFFAFLVGSFAAVINLLAAGIITTLRFFDFDYAKILLLNPLLMGLIMGFFTALLQTSGELVFETIGQAFFAGAILGIFLGLTTFLSRPTRPATSWWQRLRRSLVVGLISGLLFSVVSFDFGMPPALPGVVLHLIEGPFFFVSFCIALNVGIFLADQMIAFPPGGASIQGIAELLKRGLGATG